ncbi:MAG: hypothetical protein OXG23_03690, partial [Chloroflexi bacterium]|nr:hypothetical protein [Chloroflexota bacterium]
MLTSRPGWLIVILPILLALPAGAMAQPAAPTASTSNVSSSGLTLSWTAIAGATGYEYKRLLPDEKDSGRTNGSTTSVNITGLKSATFYSYAVRAVVGNQKSAWSVTAARFTSPTAPTNLRTTCVAGTVVKLAWNEPPRAENYEIKVDNGGWGSRGATPARIISGLSLNTQYTFHIRAVNSIADDDSFSPEVSRAVRTLATHVGEPSNLQISEVKEDSFKLTWTASGTSSVTYEVSTNGIDWTDSGSDTEHVFSNMSRNTSYNIQLRVKSGSVYSCVVKAPLVKTLPACVMHDKDAMLPEIDDKIADHRDNTGRADLVTAFSAAKTALTGGGGLANAVALAPHGGGLWERIRSALNCLNKPVPSTPTNLFFSSTHEFISFGWRVVTNALGYRVRLGTSGAWTEVNRYANHVFTGLSADTEYTMQVVATNGWLDSSSAQLAATTRAAPASAPAAPTGLTTSAITHNSATLTWTKSAGATSYEVNGGALSNWTDVGDVATYTFSGLTANTAYSDLQARAKNNDGNSAPASASASTLPNAPAAPTGLTTSGITQTAITLTWTKSAGATSYEVNGGALSNWTDVGDVATYTFSGLTANTAYSDLQARAKNNDGNSAPASASASTLPNAPAAPTGLTTSGITQTAITLTWTKSAGA